VLLNYLLCDVIHRDIVSISEINTYFNLYVEEKRMEGVIQKESPCKVSALYF
jgi:hypothetical protein